MSRRGSCVLTEVIKNYEDMFMICFFVFLFSCIERYFFELNFFCDL